MRRAHDALTGKTISTDRASGEYHLRHHITKDGFYRGRRVIVRSSNKQIDIEE